MIDKSQVWKSVDAAGTATWSLYDAAGRQTDTIQAIDVNQDGTVDATDTNGDGIPDTGSERLCTHTEYDGLGRAYQTTDAKGHTTTTVFDDQGRVSRTVYADGSFVAYGYDAMGRKVSQTTQLPATASQAEIDAATTTYGYDDLGHLTDVWQPAVLDADPNSPTFGQSVQPHSHYTFDRFGNQVAQTDAKGHTTTFAYDPLTGLQIGRTLPDGESESYTYDQYGRQATHTDFNGNVATNHYDRLGRLDQLTYTAAAGSGKTDQTVTYTYDPMGRKQTVTDASGTTTYHYDAQGNVSEEETPEGTIHYVYDPATGQHTETWTDSTDVVYGYDALGRLSTVTVNRLNGQTLTTPLVTREFYDANGNKAHEVLANGVTTDYTFDSLNRLTDLVEQQGPTVLFSQHYTLNAAGQRLSVAETERQPDSSTMTRTVTWTYDADNRLTGESVTSGDAGQVYSDTFTFDLVGNRMTQTHTGPGGGADETITYSYNGDDQLLKEVSSFRGETDYTFDANGSQTSSTNNGQATTYTFDVRNKMVAVTKDGVTTTYVYDDAGNRVQETTNGTTTYYLTDHANPTGYAQPVEEKSSASAAPSRTYVLGDRVLAQADGSGTVSYLLTDGHGSTRLLASATGTVTAALNYSVFGGAIGFDLATAGTEYLSGGDAIFDPASGLYLHGDGTRGRIGFRFIETDAPGYGHNDDPLTLHRYVYTHGDPINYLDPSGCSDFSVGGLVTNIGNAAMIGLRVGLPIMRVVQPVMTVIAVVTMISDPQVAEEFVATGGNPAELAESIAMSDLRALKAAANETKELIIAGRNLYTELRNAGVSAAELRSLQGAVSQASGSVFDEEVLSALNLVKNGEKMTGMTTAGPVNTVPDLNRALRYGIGDIKDLVSVAKTPQLQAQINIAVREGESFSIIISPRTESVAKSLWEDIRKSSGVLERYDPATNFFTRMRVDGGGNLVSY